MNGHPTDEILIVDDTPANLRLLAQMLTGRGYQVRAVTSGERALESVRAHLPGLILLDIRMKGLSGFEVCERLKADARTAAIPIIFISALSEVEDKVRAFQLGGVDYVTKPFQIEEVLARIQTHLALRRLQRQLEDANRKFHRELELAGKVQAGFLPKRLPAAPGWEFAAHLQPAHETSGDFYDLFTLPDGRIVLVVADVVDKGVGAALFMALNWSLIRTYAGELPGRPAQVFDAVNQRLLLETGADQFVTVFFGLLDPETGELRYANAGQSPPLLVGRGTVQRLPSTGIPLGIMEEAVWREECVTMRPEMSLVLYSDGVTEAQNGDGSFFGEEGLRETLGTWGRLSAAALCEAILKDLERFTGPVEQYDDIALVAASRL